LNFELFAAHGGQKAGREIGLGEKTAELLHKRAGNESLEMAIVFLALS